MKVVVQRTKSDPQCVQGEMYLDGAWEAYTLEPPHRTDGGKPRAIDAGTYTLTLRMSAHFGRLMPHVENVPGFDGVEVHWGNYPTSTEACLLVGKTQGTDFVGHSVEEFNLLFQKFHDVATPDPDKPGVLIVGTISYLDPPAAQTITNTEELGES